MRQIRVALYRAENHCQRDLNFNLSPKISREYAVDFYQDVEAFRYNFHDGATQEGPAIDRMSKMQFDATHLAAHVD